MKNKKAILVPEVLTIIISVVCIVLLIFLAVKLYGIFTQKTEIEQARAMRNQLVEFIDSLEEDTEGVYDIQTRRGDTWLVYFGDDPNNKLLCICLESNIKKDCVDDALGVCEKTGDVFEMLTLFEGGNIQYDVQYIKLNTLLVNLRIKKSNGVINIMKSIVKSSGESWEEFSSLKPEEACPNFVEEIESGIVNIWGVEGVVTEAYEVFEFDSIEEIIIDLPNYWDEVKNKDFSLFHQRTKNFLGGCVREVQSQEENEIFGVRIIFPEDDGQRPEQFVYNPITHGAPLPLEMEDYWETKLTTEDDKKIIIKIYPRELF